MTINENKKIKIVLIFFVLGLTIISTYFTYTQQNNLDKKDSCLEEVNTQLQDYQKDLGISILERIHSSELLTHAVLDKIDCIAGTADTKKCPNEGESDLDNAVKLRKTSRDFNSQARSNLAKAVLKIDECKY